MSKPRLPTLKQIAGERPRCQYCDKELKPVTDTVEVTGHVDAPPSVDALLKMPQPRPSYPSTNIAVDRGYRPERVFRMTRKVDYTKTPYTKLHFWTGKNHGYGYTDTPKLFCNKSPASPPNSRHRAMWDWITSPWSTVEHPFRWRMSTHQTRQ